MQRLALSEKTVIITGASSGVGRAAALAFASYRPALVLAGRNEHALREVAVECEGLGASTLVVVTDVTDSAAVVRLAAKAFTWKGQINVWINNAGVLAAGEFDQTPMDVHRQVVTTNLLGYMNGAHAILPYFKRQKYGTLINNISIGGFLPVPYGAGYTASKFGLRGFSEALKAELAAWPDIHVCDLFPAFLDTPGIQHAANYTGKVLKPAPPVYDPGIVATAMVQVTQYPKSNTYIGGAALPLKAAHALLPSFTTSMTGRVIETYFKRAQPIENTTGNVFETVDFGMSTHGNSTHSSTRTRKYLVGGLLAGVAISLLFAFGNDR